MIKSSVLCLLTLSLVSLTACNGGGTTATQFIKSTAVSITSQGSDSFANVTTQFDLGQNVTLAQMDATVIDPKSLLQRGTITFNQLPNGLGQITVSVNLSLITNANATLGQTLPNGKPLPLILGANPGDVLGVPVLDHSIAYIGGDTSKSVFVGAALGIKGFDQVMNQLSTPANIFFSLNVTPTIMGVAGIYGSPVAYENGIAIFGKYSAAADMESDSDSDYEIDNMNRATIRNLQRFLNDGQKHVLEFN